FRSCWSLAPRARRSGASSRPCTARCVSPASPSVRRPSPWRWRWAAASCSAPRRRARPSFLRCRGGRSRRTNSWWRQGRGTRAASSATCGPPNPNLSRKGDARAEPGDPGPRAGSLAPFREHSTVAESLPEEMVPMAEHYPPEYLEFVRLFNEGKYAESHRVLHDIWSENRSNYFYKALIQMAGAHQHWQEQSYYWAADLFRGAAQL